MNRDQTLPSDPAVTPGTFSAALARILELPTGVTDDSEARSAMTAQLELLPEGWQDKVSVLLNLGRKAHDRRHVKSSTSGSAAEGVAATPLDVLALCDKSTRSRQYLERGLAMVCAQRLDLARGGATNEKTGVDVSVFERAWSRFGRELAASEPSEWTWFGRRASGTDVLEKIYLRRGEGAWWSFAVGLDRPLKSQVGVERSRTAKRRGNDRGAGLQSLVTHQCVQRSALQRAMRSVRARMGIISARRRAVPV
jgi:hypothetical protein